MRKSTLCCIAAAILFSCTYNAKVKNGVLIRGDWVAESADTTFRNTPVIFSFNDSTCSAESPFNRFARYNIDDSMLIVQSDSVIDPGAPPTEYIVTKLTADSLYLKPGNNGDNHQNIIRLGRIKEKNNLVPERIYFASSGCFGSCTSLFLEIDSSRNILFYGMEYSQLKGGYSGKINAALYEELCRKIRQLPVSELKGFYEAPWTDDQVCGVSIKANGKIITSSAYGFNEEPAALRILLNYLMSLYYKVNLVKDDTITHFYFESQAEFSRIAKAIMPPPVNFRK